MTCKTLTATIAVLGVSAGIAGTAVKAQQNPNTHLKPADLARYETMMVQ